MPLHTQAAENERACTRPHLLSPRAPAPLALTMRTSTTSPAAAVGHPPYGPLEGPRPPPGHVPLARRFRCGPHAARAARLPAARPALRRRAAPTAPAPAAPARCHRHRHRRRPPRFLYGGHRGAPPYCSVCASGFWEATSAAVAASAPGPHPPPPPPPPPLPPPAATATATAAAPLDSYTVDIEGLHRTVLYVRLVFGRQHRQPWPPPRPAPIVASRLPSPPPPPSSSSWPPPLPPPPRLPATTHACYRLSLPAPPRCPFHVMMVPGRREWRQQHRLQLCQRCIYRLQLRPPLAAAAGGTRRVF